MKNIYFTLIILSVFVSVPSFSSQQVTINNNIYHCTIKDARWVSDQGYLVKDNRALTKNFIVGKEFNIDRKQGKMTGKDPLNNDQTGTNTQVLEYGSYHANAFQMISIHKGSSTTGFGYIYISSFSDSTEKSFFGIINSNWIISGLCD